MDLDVKEMKISIRGVLELLVTSPRSFVKKYPVVSGILLFFFILYMFLPSVFIFLVFSVPVLLFMVVALRFVFRFHQQNLEKAKGEKRNFGISARKPPPVQDDLVENKTEDSSAQPQLVRRRNAKEEDKRVSLREGVEKKDVRFSAISNDYLVDKAALIEENQNEVNVDSVIDCTESSSAASQRSRHEHGDVFEGRTNKFDYGGSELNAESSDDGEDEDEEEEAQEDGNKAVEWTETDQKNLMDLGISEMERNKRLESLIARRKAKKLLSMQVRRTLMNTRKTNPCGQIASVLITRPNPFFSNVAGEPQVSRTPGSAPSVLLPMHNPFDLPYDPQEEKPNLTGGSFEEEFMAASQKDLMFCRHESFSLGPSFPGPREFDQSRRGTFYFQNFPTRPRAPEIPEYSRFRNQSGNENPSPKLIQTESAIEFKPMLHVNSSHADAIQQGQASEWVRNLVDIHDEEDRIEDHKESNLVGDDVTGGSSSSSSSEVNVPFSAAKKEEILKSLSFLAPKNIAVGIEYNGRRNDPLCDGSPSSFRNKTPEERFFFPDKVISHTPTHSIASDMQVEVSEVSSPELTVDGTISPSDGGSLSLSYDVDWDVGKAANSGSEEMWVASSQLSKVEELESRSREVHEVSEQDIIEVRFSRMSRTSKDIIASNMLAKNIVEEDSIDAIMSFPNVELPEMSQTHLIDFDDKVHDEVRLPSTYASDALSTENLASLTHENALQSSKKSAAHPSPENNSGEPEEQSDSPEISAREVNISCDTNDVVFANDDSEILEFIKNTYGEAPVLIKGEAAEEPSASNMENDGQYSEITEVDSGVQEHDKSNPTEFFEGEFKRQSELISNLNGNDNIQDRRGEPVVIDVGSSGFDPSSNETTASAKQPEIVAEQGPSVSSSSSSSTSATQEKFPTSEVYLPNFDQTPQIKVQQIASEVVDDNFADSLMPESSDLTVSQNALHFKEGSVTCLPNDRYLEKPQLGKLVELKDMASSSRPIEKMDIWESTQDRECDQSALDIIHSGVSQISIDPTPLAILPELVVEQVPTASSSSSSPKSGVQKNVSVEQVSSVSIHTETYLKVQKFDEETVEINLLDKLLPENLEENSNSVDNYSILETSQERGQEIVEVEIPEVSPSTGLIVPVTMIDTAGSGLSRINQSFISDSNPPDMLPEVVVEQVPMASSSSSSPNSVLQSKFSIDQGSVLSLDSLDQEIRVEVQQSETEMEENALINGLQPENSIAAGPQKSFYSMRDSMAHLSDSRYSGDLQEPFNSPGKFLKEEREEPSKDDPGKRFFEEEADIVSNENELVVNMMVAEDLRSSVGEIEGESL